MHPLRPSTNLRQPWLMLEAPGEIFDSSDISGKWCIFRAPSDVDEAWRVVSGLVMTGKLLAAKVSTAQGMVFGGYQRHAICVYTRDWQDKDDVQHVREVLRSAGFDGRLQYKRGCRYCRWHRAFRLRRLVPPVSTDMFVVEKL